MRPSRSGSIRGLRSGGSQSEQTPVGNRSRDHAGGASPRPGPKRRGRALPLTKSTQSSENEEVSERKTKNSAQIKEETEITNSQNQEQASEAPEDPAAEQQGSEDESSRREKNDPENLNDRVRARMNGKNIVVAITVLGAIIDVNYDISAGLGQDGNQFFCEICKGFGNVVCCDGCPKVYHALCLPEEDPSRKALDNDEDPWFCPECLDRGVTEKAVKKATSAASPSRVVSNRAADNDKRSSTRPVKHKCIECQQSGGVMIPCEGCGVHIHSPPCRTEEESGDGMDAFCSNCRLEVMEEEEDEEAPEEDGMDDDTNSHDVSEKGSRTLRKRSMGNEHDENSSEDVSQEGDAEDEEDDEQGEDAIEDHEEPVTPDKKGRKRAGSSVNETPNSKRKKKVVSTIEKKKKGHKDKKKKKKKKKQRVDEEDDDGESQGNNGDPYSPHNRLKHRGLFRATPAFFFFLNDSKMKIERNLSRKHRYFNRLPKGMERNELIAREGAHWWVKLRLTEQKRYFAMSMRDFEGKVVEWKEEKTIREMIAARDPEDADDDLEYEDGSQDLSPEDEMTTYKRHQRLYLSTSVGSKPFTPEAGKSNNRVLLELLQDMRFHPLPMFNPLRTDGDSGLMDRSKIAIPYFDVPGPFATSVGDECSGCTRGWNHFCPVLKRRMPALENRARLQPPMSSLMATRVGLGLKPVIPEIVEHQPGREAPLFEPRLTHDAQQAKRVPAIPSFTLTNPVKRADDVVCFVEECMAMKVPEPPRPSPPSVRATTEKKKSVLSRGALPMARGRLKTGESDVPGSSSNDLKEDNPFQTLQKCGRCRTIIENDTGCIQCRRAQLVINTSKRGPGQDPMSGKDKKVDTVKVQTTMLGRLSVKDSNFDEQTESDAAIANAILKLRWMPCAVLPPQTARLPTSKAEREVENEKECEDDDATSSSEIEDGRGEKLQKDDAKMNGSNGKHEVKQDLAVNGDVGCAGGEDGGRSSRLRPRSVRAVGTDASTLETGNEMHVDKTPDRQELAKRHKDEATELARRCLNIACCGIFLAMVRRDPLCLFAEPVPSNVIGYSQLVTQPMDFSKIKAKVLNEKYTSLGSFIADCHLLCTNALAFNPPGSIYSKTAKELHDIVDVMQKRASKWIHAIKDAHSSSFAWQTTTGLLDDEVDCFKELRILWPESIEILESGDYLREQVASDFTRTKENELAYYGSIAVRRAACAAEASLAPYTDSAGIHSTVIRRSHQDDESLRRTINDKVAEQITVPIQLADIPRWREESILRTLRRVQSRRVEGNVMSENGCARCDGYRVESNKMALSAIRWGRKHKQQRKVDAAASDTQQQQESRVAESRLGLTTGLASMTARNRIGRELDGSELVVKNDKKEEELNGDGDTEGDDPNEDRMEIEATEDGTSILDATTSEIIVDGTDAGVIAAGTSSMDTEDDILAEDTLNDQWERVKDVAVNVKGSGIHGWGLFADQPFKKGDIVAEYVGEYISNAVADLREKMYQERRIQDYQFRVDENLVIDATLKGGHGRYINHNCNPNCIAKIVDGPAPNKHLKRVMIIAQRDIKAREEITYDYQFPLELDLDARIPCNCGSLLCRGFMNWDLPEKGSKNRVLRTQKRGGNMRDRIRRLGRPLKKQEQDYDD